MVDTVPQIIWIADADGRLEFPTPANSPTITGAAFQSLSPAEIAGALIHPGDGPHVVAAFQAAPRQRGRAPVEQRIRSAAGELSQFPGPRHPYRDPRTARSSAGSDRRSITMTAR